MGCHTSVVGRIFAYCSLQAAQRANEEAMQQRARDQARLQEEMERRRMMEDEMRAQQLQQQEGQEPAAEGDIERLQRIEQQQREEIQR